MADITMCVQTQCPKASHCYRVQAKASEWQSVAAFEYRVDNSGAICPHYIKFEPATDKGAA